MAIEQKLVNTEFANTKSFVLVWLPSWARHPRDTAKCFRAPKASKGCSDHDTQSHPPSIAQTVTTMYTALQASENAVNVSSNTNKIIIFPQHGGLPYYSPPIESMTRRQLYKECGHTDPDEDISSPSYSRTTELAETEPHQIGLPGLPTEIMLIVAQYLPPSGLMSLSYSFRVIRNRLSVSIEDSLGPKIKTAQLSMSALGNNFQPRISPNSRRFTHSQPTTVRNVHHMERLELLCMLDRDQMIPPSKAVCSGCADTHDRSMFSPGYLAQSSHERLCFGSAGCVWICPHQIFDHDLVNTSKEPLRDHRCGRRGVRIYTPDLETKEHHLSWPILVLGGNHDPPSKEIVANVLALTDVNVCKHLHFSDTCLLDLYSPNCKKLRCGTFFSFCPCSLCAEQLPPPNANDCSTLGSLNGRKCSCCGAWVMFFITENLEGGETLYLVIVKMVRNFQGCTDPAWIDQVTDPAEFEGLEGRWNAATARKAQTVQDRVSA